MDFRFFHLFRLFDRCVEATAGELVLFVFDSEQTFIGAECSV